MKKSVSNRFNYFISFLIVSILIGISFVLETYKGLTPCPLCILQRVMMITLCVLFLIGMLIPFKKISGTLLALLCLLTSFGGLLFAGRQVWLQYVPPVGEGGCGVSLQYLLSIFPLPDVLKMVWQGGTECSEVGWVFLRLSLAQWSLVAFGFFFVFSLLQLKRILCKRAA